MQTDYSLIAYIGKILNNRDFIFKIQSSEDVDELGCNVSNYRIAELCERESYIGMTLLGHLKGQIIGEQLNLTYLGAGYSRASYAIGKYYCIKIALNEEGLVGNKNEITFYRFIKREHPELLGVFTPILAYNDYFIITYAGIPSSFSNLEPKNYHILAILKMLEGKGILMEDLENRPDNFIEVAGKLCICDYAEWSTTDKKLLEDYHYVSLLGRVLDK